MKLFLALILAALLLLAACAIRRPLEMRIAPCWPDYATGYIICPAGCQACPPHWACKQEVPAYPTQGLAWGRWDATRRKLCTAGFPVEWPVDEPVPRPNPLNAGR